MKKFPMQFTLMIELILRIYTDQQTTTVLLESYFCALRIATLWKMFVVHTTFLVILTCINIRAIFHTFIRMQIKETNFPISNFVNSAL